MNRNHPLRSIDQSNDQRKIWISQLNEIVERFHLTFCKILINIEMLIPNYMIYGELSCYNMDVISKCELYHIGQDY